MKNENVEKRLNMLPFLNQPTPELMYDPITEGDAPRTSTVAQMRESQRKGSVGIGMNEQSFNESMDDFGQGCGDCPKR